MYAYFYSLHVSGSHLLIIRRIIVSMRHLVFVTLCRWPSGMQVYQTAIYTECVKLVIYNDRTKMRGQQNKSPQVKSDLYWNTVYALNC